jgi:hypothetical protein
MEDAESLLETLIGEDLGSVIFLGGYVQLDFNGPRLSAFVWPRVDAFGMSWTFGDSGYRDSLCGFIGRMVTAVADTPEDGIVIRFDSDALTIKPVGFELQGPEIAMLQMNDESRRWDIWRPGEGSFTHGDW